MKLILIVSFVILNFSFNAQAQQSNPSWYDANSGFWRFSEENYKHGYNDNSFSWQYVQTPVTAQIVDVLFIDSLFGWAGHTANGCMRTTDSGFNWIVTIFNDTNFTTSYNAVHFINQNTGWAVGGAVQIRKTTNGGANWFKQYA